MIAAAISDFRAHISKYLAIVSNGKEVVITSRGKEIARVMPPENKTSAAQKNSRSFQKLW